MYKQEYYYETVILLFQKIDYNLSLYRVHCIKYILVLSFRLKTWITVKRHIIQNYTIKHACIII